MITSFQKMKIMRCLCNIMFLLHLYANMKVVNIKLNMDVKNEKKNIIVIELDSDQTFD